MSCKAGRYSRRTELAHSDAESDWVSTEWASVLGRLLELLSRTVCTIEKR